MILEVIGQKEYDRLKVKSQQIFKYTGKDYEMMEDILREKLKALENEYGKLISK